MECYSQEFSVNAPGGSTYPRRPAQFKSIKAAKIAYTEFVADLDRFGMGEPSSVWLFFGNKNEVDFTNGIYFYSDFLDVLMTVGARGGIKTERIY